MKMKQPEYNYVDTAFGKVHKRNNVMTVDEFMEKIKTWEGEAYRSVFRFTKEYADYCARNGSVAGYSGMCYADFLPFDFDFEDRSEALNEVKKFAFNLRMIFRFDASQIQYYFSGNKGFHLLISSKVFGGFEPSPRLPQIFKEIARDLTEDLKVDLAIYDINRLFRVPNTKHPTSGLFKIPIDHREFLPDKRDIKPIEKMAKSTRMITRTQKVEECSKLRDIYEKYKYAETPSKKVISAKRPQIPNGKKPCIYTLLEGVQMGNRHNACLRIADYLKKEGYVSDLTFALITAWNDKNSEPLPANELERVVKDIYTENYDFGCKDPILQSLCGNRCLFKGGGTALEDIKDMADLEQEYREYVSNILTDKITFNNWIPRLGECIGGLCSGEVMIIVAGAGVGKSAFIQNMLLKVDVTSLLISLELPDVQVFQRFLQMGESASGDQIEDNYTKRTYSADVEKTYGNIYVVSRPSRSLQDVREYVRLTEEQKAGKKIGLLAIDYLGLLSGEGYTIYERVSKLARDFKSLAKDTGTRVVVLTQTSRGHSKGNEPLSIDAARDSGAIEEGADFVIGLWRPDRWETENDDTMILSVLKNRKGQEGVNITCNWEPNTLQISERAVVSTSNKMPEQRSKKKPSKNLNKKISTESLQSRIDENLKKIKSQIPIWEK